MREKAAHVTTPNKDIFILGFRLDQIYTRENASEEDKKGMVTKCDIAFGVSLAFYPSASVSSRTFQ